MTATILSSGPANSFVVETGGGVYFLTAGASMLQLSRQTGAGITLIATATIADRAMGLTFNLTDFLPSERHQIIQDVSAVFARVGADVAVAPRLRVACKKIHLEAEGLLGGTAHT